MSPYHRISDGSNSNHSVPFPAAIHLTGDRGQKEMWVKTIFQLYSDPPTDPPPIDIVC